MPLLSSILHCNPLRAQNQLQNDEIGEFSVDFTTNAGPIPQNAEILPPENRFFLNLAEEHGFVVHFDKKFGKNSPKPFPLSTGFLPELCYNNVC